MFLFLCPLLHALVSLFKHLLIIIIDDVLKTLRKALKPQVKIQRPVCILPLVEKATGNCESHFLIVRYHGQRENVIPVNVAVLPLLPTSTPVAQTMAKGSLAPPPVVIVTGANGYGICSVVPKECIDHIWLAEAWAMACANVCSPNYTIKTRRMPFRRLSPPIPS